jgi:hypothetical protein
LRLKQLAVPRNACRGAPEQIVPGFAEVESARGVSGAGNQATMVPKY